ncbi:MAG: HEAT repeat domain-containing protein, partial [Pirellulales bacterium]
MKCHSSRFLLICGCLLLAPQDLLLARAQSPVQVTQADTAAAIATLQSDAPLYDRAMACRSLAIAGDAGAIEALAAELDSVELAAYARQALEEIADAAATDALLDALGRVSGSARAGILASLGRRADSRAVPTMARLMDDEDDEVAVAAMMGLASLATDDAMQALINQAQGGATRPSSLAAALLLAATRRGGEPDDAFANAALAHIDGLMDQVADGPSESVRAELRATADAANYHLILRRADDAPARLAALLANDRRDAFRLGVQAARGVSDLGAPALLEAFPAGNPQRQLAMLAALSDSQAPEALPVVLAASHSPDADLRRCAIECLGDWSQGESVSRLLEALADTDADLVDAASSSLAKLDATAVDEALLVRLSADSAVIREAAATLVGTRGIAAAEDRLFALTTDDNAAVAQAAVRALGAVVSDSRTGDLVGLLATGNIDHAAFRDAVTAAGQRLSRDTTVKEIAKAFAGADT